MGRPVAVMLAVCALALCAAAPASAAPAWRGIIEGAYGTPWDHGARVRMLTWMPQHGFNAYVHAPKDDLYQRALWRHPWPQQDLSDYLGEAELARSLHVRWIPNVSPGAATIPTPLPAGTSGDAPLCFSCPADLEIVVDKLAPFLDAGGRVAMVSFDDVREELTHAEDVAAFGPGPGAFGAATGVFLDRLYDALAARWPGTQLLSVPSDYAGTRDSAYLEALRRTLRPGVQLMWTGTRVRSAHWTPEDARAYAALIGRTPIVWDNWTNNDAFGGGDDAGSARVFLGPYGRPAATIKAVAGFFFNPASEPDLNKLPLATAGDWLLNPWRYNARTAWLRAVGSIARPGSGMNAALRAWAEASYSTKLSSVEGPTFVRLSRQFLGAYDGGSWWTHALGQLRSELWLAADARRTLARLPDAAFYEQARPFLDATAQAAQAGAVAATLLEAERPALRAARTVRNGFVVHVAPASPARAAELWNLLEGWKAYIRTSGRLVYGWRSRDGRGIPPYGRPNVMDEFIAQVEQRDAAWRQSPPGAAAAVSITVDGRPGPPPVGGIVRLSGRNCGGEVLAGDGAGGRTSLRLPGCR